ncbi:MAG: (d)CMP kinase [Acholeplasmatales bacterium]|jgi:cytidylate kinase|nr:(d)CMP kinase [Acholeplasmatales bacterium]
MSNFLVAIDGPAGSGKSTISENISARCGFIHIDTGSMYRAITLYAINNNLVLDDPNSYSFIDKINIRLSGDKIYLDGKDITRDIRNRHVTENVSLVSSISIVREKLVCLQKKLAIGKIVMDGRDIGSVVLPNANLKIFLTAESKIRAYRRLKEKNETINETDLIVEEKNIKRRDELDSNRVNSPLVVPAGAIIIDTTKLNIEEVTNKIIDLINERLNK